MALATVMDQSQVFVQIRIPSSKFADVGIGTPVSISLDSLPDKTVAGKVTRLSGQADPLTGNMVVFATIDNSDQRLRPGLNCRVSVALPEIKDALTIPFAALGDSGGTPVVTLIRNGQAFETEVETGTETADLVQITQGLSDGDTVATAGGYGCSTVARWSS